LREKITLDALAKHYFTDKKYENERKFQSIQQKELALKASIPLPMIGYPTSVDLRTK